MSCRSPLTVKLITWSLPVSIRGRVGPEYTQVRVRESAGVQIEFYGAAGEVTGSCHILTVRGKRILLDCGMIQGGRDATERNRREFPFVPADIDAVVLSHAHIDHSGRLPLLVKRGFRGPIYTNAACRDLLPILWRDTADLGLREVERINRRREPDDPVATPLYELDDVERALKLVRALRYDTKYEPLPGVSLILRDAGHILGSSSVLLECSDEGLSARLSSVVISASTIRRSCSTRTRSSRPIS